MSLVRDLFKKQKESLDYFFERVDHSVVEKMLDVFLACQGVIFFTGVGKSGLIAKKIAVTMTSTGTKALYLSPLDALHGDIGMVSPRDVFVLISKSGESDELLNLIPYLRNKGVFLICMVSKPKSRLAKGCDLTIHLPLNHELCPFDLAPTNSSLLQMMVGHVLAISLMKKKNFDIEQYKLNHPAGRIGKQLNLKVKDLMLKGEALPFCKADDKLVDVLVELSDKRCGCLLVVNAKSQLLGIFTDGDLRRALQREGSHALDQSLEKLMILNPRSVDPEALAVEALKIMEGNPKSPITVLPVLKADKTVAGLIKMHDIVQSGL